jgi:hypothetical protein
MKKLTFFLLIFIPVYLFSQTFQIDYRKSCLYLGGVLALDLFNNYYDRNNNFSLNESEIAKILKSNIPAFDRIALRPMSKNMKDYSDYAVYFTVSSALVLTFDKNEFITNGLVFSEILLTQSMICKWTKTITLRKRPYVYDDNVSLAKKQQRNSQHSFYSSHSSTAFSAATYAYFYHTKKNGKNVPLAIFLYGSATATAVFRVLAANHFPSDVVVGALMGTGISYLICEFHFKSRKK